MSPTAVRRRSQPIMSTIASRIAALKRSQHFWTVAGVSVVALGALTFLLPFDAFASQAPRLASKSASTTRDTLEVSIDCPKGTTATGVSATLDGFDKVSLDRMWPAGRKAYARASAKAPVTSSWTLRAWAICIPQEAGLQYVTVDRTETKVNNAWTGVQYYT